MSWGGVEGSKEIGLAALDYGRDLAEEALFHRARLSLGGCEEFGADALKELAAESSRLLCGGVAVIVYSTIRLLSIASWSCNQTHKGKECLLQRHRERAIDKYLSTYPPRA